jgi:hypothetical protein
LDALDAVLSVFVGNFGWLDGAEIARTPTPLQGAPSIDGNMRSDLTIRHTVVSRRDIEMMHQIERIILGYQGDNLLHDIELTFPGASYRAFFLAWGRTRDPARWLPAEGQA